jgi:hypothetical protein
MLAHVDRSRVIADVHEGADDQNLRVRAVVLPTDGRGVLEARGKKVVVELVRRLLKRRGGRGRRGGLAGGGSSRRDELLVIGRAGVSSASVTS